MDGALWFYEEAGRQTGPVSQAALAEAIRLGRLPAGSRVWTAGMPAWQPWESIPALAALAGPTRPGAGHR